MNADRAASEETTPIAAGHWCAFVCGPSSGWDRTILGIALYSADGDLTFARWDGAAKAIQRGDWKEEWFQLGFNPDPTWAQMEARLGRFGNAMSHARWEGGLGTLAWDNEMGERLFRQLVIGE